MPADSPQRQANILGHMFAYGNPKASVVSIEFIKPQPFAKTS